MGGWEGPFGLPAIAPTLGDAAVPSIAGGPRRWAPRGGWGATADSVPRGMGPGDPRAQASSSFLSWLVETRSTPPAAPHPARTVGAPPRASPLRADTSNQLLLGRRAQTEVASQPL